MYMHSGLTVCIGHVLAMRLKIALHARDFVKVSHADWPLRASVRPAGDQIMYNSSTAG